MKQILKNNWNIKIGDEFKKDYYLELRKFLVNDMIRSLLKNH